MILITVLAVRVRGHRRGRKSREVCHHRCARVMGQKWSMKRERATSADDSTRLSRDHGLI
jgi:hypothetical protein